jgi:hypothetical protein
MTVSWTAHSERRVCLALMPCFMPPMFGESGVGEKGRGGQMFLERGSTQV